MNKVFTSLGDVHVESCRKESKKFYACDATEWQFLSSEVLYLLKTRAITEKNIYFISHSTIHIFNTFIKKRLYFKG